MSIKTFTISITNKERMLLRHAISGDISSLERNGFGDAARALDGRLGSLVPDPVPVAELTSLRNKERLDQVEHDRMVALETELSLSPCDNCGERHVTLYCPEDECQHEIGQCESCMTDDCHGAY